MRIPHFVKIAMIAAGFAVTGCAYPQHYPDYDRGGPVYYEPRHHPHYRPEPVPSRYYYERRVERPVYYQPRPDERYRPRDWDRDDYDRDRR